MIVDVFYGRNEDRLSNIDEDDDEDDDLKAEAEQMRERRRNNVGNKKYVCRKGLRQCDVDD